MAWPQQEQQSSSNNAQPMIGPALHRRSVSTNSHFMWNTADQLGSFQHNDASRREHHHFQQSRPSDSWSWRAPVGSVPAQPSLAHGHSGVKTQGFHPAKKATAHTNFMPHNHVRAMSQHAASNDIGSLGHGGRRVQPIGKPVLPDADAVGLGQRFSGKVHSLKHSYGFVRCDVTGDRIFFHFSEIDRASLAALPDVPPDQPPVVIGDRVEFSRTHDAQSGREKATNVAVLPRGDASAANKGVSGLQPSMGAGKAQGGARAFPIQAVATLPSPESPELLGSPKKDMSAEIRRDRELGKRETGVVVSTKHSYGFIKCAERDHKQVFFHFSEVADDTSLIRPGTEIEFTISANPSGKVVATRVRILPAGSVVFAIVNDYTVTGVIKTGVENNQSASQKTRRKARPSSMDVGSLVVPEEQLPIAGLSPTRATHERTLTFSGADMKFPGISLMEGDQVQFRVKTDRRTHARTATEVLLVRPSPAGRNRGIITIWKELYGFLKCDGRKDHLFVHLNEFIDKTHHPQVGDEVEFNVALDNRNQDNATRVLVLPKGSVVLRDDRIFGVVLSKPASFQTTPSSFQTPASRRTNSEISMTSMASASGAGPSYGTIRLFPLRDDNGSPQVMSEEQISELKPLPTDHASVVPAGGIVSPIAEDSEPKRAAAEDAAANWSPVSAAATPPAAAAAAHRGMQSWRGLSDVASAQGVAADESPMNSVRFTLADRENDRLALRRGDLISLAVAPAPKFLRASNIRLVPKHGVVNEISAQEAIVNVPGSAYAGQEHMLVMLNELSSEVGQLKVGDEVEVHEVGIPQPGRTLRIARGVTRASSERLIDSLVELLPELTQVASSPAAADSASSAANTPDGASTGHRRWDSRLEPRTWA